MSEPVDPMAEFRRDLAVRVLLVVLAAPGFESYAEIVKHSISVADQFIAEIAKR